MNRSEMHIVFRQLGQQMGMQNIRTILPEQIDLLLNLVISDTINQLIKVNVGLTNNRVAVDNSKVSQINAFRSLYKVVEANALTNPKPFFTFDYIDKDKGKFSTIPNNNLLIDTENDVLFFVDFSISYRKAYVGINEDSEIERILWNENSSETNYFPVRLVDDSLLSSTLNDYMLQPKVTSPILVTYGSTSNNIVMELYAGKLKEYSNTGLTLKNQLLPYKFRISYVAKPAKVGENSDCNLPEYMHYDIVKRAVDMYRISTSGALYQNNNQQVAQTSSTNNIQQ